MFPQAPSWPADGWPSSGFGAASFQNQQVAAIAAKYNAPYWLPRQETCWADTAGTPAVEGSLVKIILDERYRGALGSELATNGDFASDTWWTKDTGVIIAGGVALFTAVTTSLGVYRASLGVSGRLYKVTYTVVLNSGTVRVGAGGAFGTNRTASGTYTEYIVCGTTNQTIGLFANTAFDGSIDNISFKEVLGHNAIAYTSAASMILRKNLNREPMVSPTTGETWTFAGTHIANRSGIAWDADGVPYLQCSGAASNYASTQDSAALSIVGDCSIEVCATPVSYTGVLQGFTAKSVGSSVGEFYLSLDATGKLLFQWFKATVAQTATSTVAVPFSAGQKGYMRGKRTIGVSVVFETSLDGVTWTQLGTTVDATLLLAPDETSSVVIVGGKYITANVFNGKLYYVKIWNNATASGTPVADFNPAAANVYRPPEYYLDGDGAATFYSVPSALGILRNVVGSTLVVAQQELGAGTRYHMEVNTNAASTERNALRQNGANQYTQAIRRLDAEAIAAQASAVAPNNLRLVASSRTDYANGLAYLRVNNVAASALTLTSAGNTSDTDSYAVSIGALQTSLTAGTGFSNGPFSGAMICPAFMTEAEVKTVERYFGSKNGVTI